MTVPDELIFQAVQSALQEDIGSGDLTAQLIPDNQTLELNLLCRELAVLCGRQWFNQAFHQLDPDIIIDWSHQDGDLVIADQSICRLKGNARSLLTAERTALNFLQTLSGTATTVYRYQQQIGHTDCYVLDTRKTIPNLRLAQKYAVICGGGMNHRIGLYDAFLLKENHLKAAGSMADAVKQARIINNDALLEVEVENLQELEQAISARVDRVLLDNFSRDDMLKAVDRVRQHNQDNRQITLEASGNITDETLVEVAETGVDFISVGALTKHVRAIDFSLRFVD